MNAIRFVNSVHSIPGTVLAKARTIPGGWHDSCSPIVGMDIARGNSWHGYCKGAWDAFGMHCIWDAFGMHLGCICNTSIVGMDIARGHGTWHVKALNKV